MSVVTGNVASLIFLFSGPRSSVSAPLRYKVWQHDRHKCADKMSREICIISTGDLWRVTKSPAMFVNKLHADYSPLAYTCLEQWMEQKVDRERTADAGFAVESTPAVVSHHL